MSFLWLALGVLCVWRLTHLLVVEDGPWRAVARLRSIAGGGFWGRLLDCFYCLSLWVSFPLALLIGTTWPERVALWPALSAGALGARAVTDGPGRPVCALVPAHRVTALRLAVLGEFARAGYRAPRILTFRPSGEPVRLPLVLPGYAVTGSR